MNNILVFIDAYKNLDELCRQIFSSDRGVSEYIDEMDTNGYGPMCVSGWDNDYRQLKRLRWVRNQLVHEPNSFEDDLFSEEDIIWLEAFRARIIDRTDPLVLAYQIQENHMQVRRQPSVSAQPVQADRAEASPRPAATPTQVKRVETSPSPAAKPKTSASKSVAAWAGIILLVIILVLFYTIINK